MGEFSGFALVPEQGAIPQKHQLDPDMQRRIEAMAARVDIRDNAAVMGLRRAGAEGNGNVFGYRAGTDAPAGYQAAGKRDADAGRAD